MIKAAADYDVPELMAIFGPDGEDFIESADPVRDKNNGVAFAKEAAAKNSIELAKSNPNRATIIVGDEEWPFPVPLVKKNGKWYFNAKEGRQEILYRRIGANELDAITVCRGYVEAQKEYALEIHDDSGVNQYAQKILASLESRTACIGRIRTAHREDRSARPWPRRWRKAIAHPKADFTATTSRS